MQALKALVIIMGVLIVIGTVIVVVTIYNRVTRLGETDAPPIAVSAPLPTAAAPPSAGPSFGTSQVAIPDGCRVVEMVPAGDRLLLRLGSVARCSRIIVVDLASGAELGSIELVPAAPAQP